MSALSPWVLFSRLLLLTTLALTTALPAIQADLSSPSFSHQWRPKTLAGLVAGPKLDIINLMDKLWPSRTKGG